MRISLDECSPTANEIKKHLLWTNYAVDVKIKETGKYKSSGRTYPLFTLEIEPNPEGGPACVMAFVTGYMISFREHQTNHPPDFEKC